MLDGVEGRPAGGRRKVARSPKVCAPQFPAHLGKIALSQETGRDALEGVDQGGDRVFGRKRHEEMNVVVLAVHLAQLAAKVGHDRGERLPQVLSHPIGDGTLPVFSHEDQVQR